jgi:hypothetical protein
LIVERLKERERVFASMRISAEADARLRSRLHHPPPSLAVKPFVIAAALVGAVAFGATLATIRGDTLVQRTPAALSQPTEVGVQEVDPAPTSREDVSPPSGPPVTPPVAQVSKRAMRIERVAGPTTLMSIDDVVETISRLRAEGRAEEAARFIEARLAVEPDAHAAELFLFELGSLLEHPIRDRARACATWREYLRRFPEGRYVSHAKGSLDACDTGNLMGSGG